MGDRRDLQMAASSFSTVVTGSISTSLTDLSPQLASGGRYDWATDGVPIVGSMKGLMRAAALSG